MNKCKLGMISQERLKIEIKLLLSANSKSYMPHRLAQQRMTLNGHFTHCTQSLQLLSYLLLWLLLLLSLLYLILFYTYVDSVWCD